MVLKRSGWSLFPLQFGERCNRTIMVLKLPFSVSRRNYNPGCNRTIMVLKRVHMKRDECDCQCCNRTIMVLKPAVWAHERIIVFCQLQSNHYGIETGRLEGIFDDKHLCCNRTIMVLKLDLRGVPVPQQQRKLQSNHYGIETTFPISGGYDYPTLQSNHYGIETEVSSASIIASAPGCNRTIMVLKRVYDFVYDGNLTIVAIEPLWYWNLGRPVFLFPFSLVAIEPLWYWNLRA